MLSQLANSVCLSVLMSLGFPWQFSKLLLGVDTKEQLLLVPVPNGPVYTYSKQLQLRYKIGIKTAVCQSSAKICKIAPCCVLLASTWVIYAAISNMLLWVDLQKETFNVSFFNEHSCVEWNILFCSFVHLKPSKTVPAKPSMKGPT